MHEYLHSSYEPDCDYVNGLVERLTEPSSTVSSWEKSPQVSTFTTASGGRALSPEDRFQRVITRAQEYLRMGVANIWIIDPESRERWIMGSNGGALPMTEDAFTIPGTPVWLAKADTFDEIDIAPKA